MNRFMGGLLFLLGLLATSSAELFALNDTTSGFGTFRLVTLAKDGSKLPVSKSGAEIPYFPGSTCVDPDHSVLYFLGQPQSLYNGPNMTLVGVSLVNGTVISTSTIPFTAETSDLFFASVEYASDLGFVIVSGTTAPPRKHLLLTYHPGTGDWKVVNTIDLQNPGSTATPNTLLPRRGVPLRCISAHSLLCMRSLCM